MSSKRALSAAVLAATISMSALTFGTGFAGAAPGDSVATAVSELQRRRWPRWRPRSQRRRAGPRTAGPGNPRATKPANQRATKPPDQRAAKPANQRAAKPANQRAAKPANQRATEPANQRAARSAEP